MAPNLDTLPSELRKLIVSYLAPHPDSLRPGCKSHLKNANLAHACLREWVPEYMFRDMALKHVLVGISSHLELFAFTPETDRLLKHVKHIAVQVPPAIRWEVGLEDPGRLTIEGHTTERLYKKFRVHGPSELHFDSKRYCHDYYQAMVKPFTHGNWYRLLRAAQSSWSQVFKHFPTLEEISVGACSIVDHPSPTLTYVFVLRNGKSVMEELDPPFLQDDAANIGWASSIVLKTAPSTVRSLRLGLANLDNFNSFSTVNRVLSLGYRWPHIRPDLELEVTRLSLTLRGIAGTHGSQIWNGYTGSVGPAKHLRAVLKKIIGLQHLEFRDDLSNENTLRFSDASMTNPKDCLLNWILPYVRLEKLRTLRLSGFLLDEATVQETTLAGHWPCLETLTLDNIELLLLDSEDTSLSDSRKRQHLNGQSWLDLCWALVGKMPGLQIEIGSPLSRVSDQSPQGLDPLYVETIQLSPYVTVTHYVAGELVADIDV